MNGKTSENRERFDRLISEVSENWSLERIAKAVNINNSDVDLCKFNGKVILYYSWGNQQGVEHLAQGVYEDTLERFLRGFFPVEV